MVVVDDEKLAGLHACVHARAVRADPPHGAAPRPPPAGPPSLVRPSVSAAASSVWRQPPLHRHDSSGSEAASVAPSEASSVWPSGLSAQWLRAPSGTALGASPLVQMSGEGQGRLLAWRASVLSTEAHCWTAAAPCHPAMPGH